MLCYSNTKFVDAPEGMLVHQVPCEGNPVYGVSYNLFNKYPTIYARFKEFQQSPACDIGACQILSMGKNKFLANAFNQQVIVPFSEDLKVTNYKGFLKSMKLVSEIARSMKVDIAVPYKIGAWNGGGEWDIILNILEDVFSKQVCTIYKSTEASWYNRFCL